MTLHDRIRAVVEERLRIARAALGPERWRHSANGFVTVPRSSLGGYDLTFTTTGLAVGEHIAANDPADAILSAEHALWILERHYPDPVMEQPRCVCIDPWSLEDPWPCAEILALATRWRVEVDG